MTMDEVKFELKVRLLVLALALLIWFAALPFIPDGLFLYVWFVWVSCMGAGHFWVDRRLTEMRRERRRK